MRKPLAGAIYGIILGLAVAVILQQQGVWPLDKITVFLLPGVVGLIGILITSVGRAGSTGALTVSLIVTVAAVGYGATGLADVNEVGQLNGGCQVIAMTSVPDSTTVTDSSRSDPFQIDPDGGLVWAATSPVAFMDYDWKIWVELGGIQVTLDSGHEGNEGGSQENAGDVPNVREYAEARNIPISEMLGVYKVGGDAASPGGCNGFGFVKLIADPLETTASKVAVAIAILALIALLITALRGRGGGGVGAADTGATETAGDDGAGGDAGGATGAAGAILGDSDENGDVDSDDEVD